MIRKKNRQRKAPMSKGAARKLLLQFCGGGFCGRMYGFAGVLGEFAAGPANPSTADAVPLPLTREACCRLFVIWEENAMRYDQHWTSVWGNAVSVAENRPERYAKNITIRYGINMPFSGSAIRLTFDNYCGTEPITLTKTTAFHAGEFYPV